MKYLAPGIRSAIDAALFMAIGMGFERFAVGGWCSACSWCLHEPRRSVIFTSVSHPLLSLSILIVNFCFTYFSAAKRQWPLETISRRSTLCSGGNALSETGFEQRKQR